jgi:glycosyltransferase involved in cell wall biosynthesis
VISNPKVTFVLFSYNQESYVGEAVAGALQQTYSPLKIIFSDDYSNDNTYNIIADLTQGYSGPHDIELRRNERNLGLIAHINRVLSTCETVLIVLAAGDDVSDADRTKKIVDVFLDRKNEYALIHSAVWAYEDSNPNPVLLNPPQTYNDLENMFRSNAIYIGATAALSRSFYKKFGPITFENAYEDLIFGFRAFLLGSLVYVGDPLVRYRVGSGMSFREHPTTWRQRFIARKHQTRVLFDVLRQRKRDYEFLYKNKADKNVTRFMTEAIREINLKHTFYQKPLKSLLFLIRSDVRKNIFILAREVKYILGLYG